MRTVPRLIVMAPLAWSVPESALKVIEHVGARWPDRDARRRIGVDGRREPLRSLRDASALAGQVCTVSGRARLAAIDAAGG